MDEEEHHTDRSMNTDGFLLRNSDNEELEPVSSSELQALIASVDDTSSMYVQQVVDGKGTGWTKLEDV